MGRLEQGIDAGGRRFYLDGRPVHCGDALELRLPGEVWVAVRFETTFPSELRDAGPDAMVPVLHLYLGHQWESRFVAVPTRVPDPDRLCACPTALGHFTHRSTEPCATCGRPYGHPEEEHAVYDRKHARVVSPDERDEDGSLVYADAGASRWSSRRRAVQAALSLNRTYAACPGVEVPFHTQAELRWPEQARS